MDMEKLQKDIERSGKIVKFALIAVPSIYFCWFWLFNDTNLSSNSGDWGTFGDFVGGILNPAIAFFAFFWLTKSIQIQKQELEETKRAVVEQTETQKRQRFEDTFFSLLDQHNVILSKVLSETDGEVTASIGDIKSTHRKSKIKKIKREIFSPEINSLKEAKKVMMANNYLYGHYFRVLYQLLRLIATHCPGSGVGISFKSTNIVKPMLSREEKVYSNIVRSFLDYDVTQLLAVNCYCDDNDNDFYKFKLIIERYEFLEHMPFRLETGCTKILKECLTVYDRKAFGKNAFLGQVEELKIA